MDELKKTLERRGLQDSIADTVLGELVYVMIAFVLSSLSLLCKREKKNFASSGIQAASSTAS